MMMLTHPGLISFAPSSFFDCAKVSIDTRILCKMKRPSDHELGIKLKEASKAASRQLIRLMEPDVIIADLLDLDSLVEDLPGVLVEILREIQPRHYAGRRPPAKSYETVISGRELFAFKWLSATFGCDMYLKFALKDDFVWLVSLHKDRGKKRGDRYELPQ